jgi:hypothetical protein
LKLDSDNLLRTVKILVVLLLIALSLVIFMRSMAQRVVDPEHVSCAAGVLLTKGKMIYRDFACVAQMPYHPFLCAAIFKALNTTHYLFAARMLTVACDILIIICIISIFQRVFTSFPITGRLFGMAMTVLYVFNYHVDKVNGFALNRDFMILCILLSFWLFISTDFERKSRYLRIGAMSALLTLATCLHVSAVFIQLLFFVMLLIQHAESGRKRLKTALPFLIAPVIVLILPLWTMVQAPHAFFINIVEMPVLRMHLMRRTQVMMGTTLYDKILQVLTYYFADERGIFPFVIVICLTVLVLLGRRKLELPNLKNALLAVFVPVIFLIIGLCVPEFSYENFAMLIPFIIISFAYPLLYLRRLESINPHVLFRIALILVIAFSLAQAASQPFALLRVSRILRPQSWIPMKVHQISEEIAQKAGEPKLVATLAPLYALESGCDIYPELSSGLAGCKIAGVMSDAKRQITNTLNEETFKETLAKKPPCVVVIEGKPLFSVGLVILRIAKTKWPEQDYDETMWERKEYPLDVVIYFRL